MTLQELADKQAVELEVIWGDKSFSLQTKVEGKSESGILLRPYIVKNQEITVNREMAKSFIFNIYAIDEETRHRICWKQVDVMSVLFDGEHYYACRVKSFLRDSKESDRRAEDRMTLGISGTCVDPTTKKRANIWIKDISERGIGFLAEKDVEFEKINQRVVFTDSIRDEDFEFSFGVKIVRSVEEDGKMLYGCKIVEMPKNISLYIFMRKMSIREMRS